VGPQGGSASGVTQGVHQERSHWHPPGWPTGEFHRGAAKGSMRGFPRWGFPGVVPWGVLPSGVAQMVPQLGSQRGVAKSRFPGGARRGGQKKVVSNTGVPQVGPAAGIHKGVSLRGGNQGVSHRGVAAGVRTGESPIGVTQGGPTARFPRVGNTGAFRMGPHGLSTCDCPPGAVPSGGPIEDPGARAKGGLWGARSLGHIWGH
jgi:hypothetical protein